MNTNIYSLYKHSSFGGRIGVAQANITPPIGIHLGNWGAAKSYTAIGIHRPLLLTCITFQSLLEEQPLVLIAADLGWWKNMEDENFLRQGILNACSLEPSQLMFCFSHTHAGPGLCRDDRTKPGGEYIEPYLISIQQTAITVITEALATATPATITWQYGKCGLAANRDLPDAGRIAVGFNPGITADDTLLVGRISNEQGTVIATIVNYACHPTTLAWDNLLISPDYIGSMRELIESATRAPCLFMQGASGELAPAEQYTSDVSIADKHGRQLGYAVMSTLDSMLAPNTGLSFEKIVESAAPLATWKKINYTPSKDLLGKLIQVHFPLKKLGSIAELEDQWKQCDDLVEKERLWRKLNVRKAVGNEEKANIPLWLWQLGDSFLVGQPNEAYSWFQLELRRAYPQNSIAVMNVVNGHIGYLPPAELYSENLYPAWQTPFAQGSLELLTQTCLREIQIMSAPAENKTKQ